jgi:hypothetical protein
VTRLVQVVVQQLVRAGVRRDVAGFVAFAVDSQMGYSAAGVDVFDLEAAEFFAAQTVIEEGG